jgi:hypothetical protein
MTPLYGFGDKTKQPCDYKCDCTLCGGDQTDWEALSDTQKMVRALLLIALYKVSEDWKNPPSKN